MPVIYAAVARGTDGAVLAEWADVKGNASQVAENCMKHVIASSDSRMTITADGYTFNFLKSDGWIYVAVADEAFGRQVPFALAQRAAREWEAPTGPAAKARGAAARSYDRSFGPKLRAAMDELNADPASVNKVAAVQRQVDDVKSVMVENIEKVLARGDRIQLLVDRTEDLQAQAQQFQKQGRQLRTNMWWQNAKMKLCIVLIVLIVLAVIVLIACFSGGNRCIPKKEDGGYSPPPPAPADAPSSPIP